MQRNPLILFFVGALVAVMLFAGIRTARNNRANGPANGQLMGSVAPDFQLQSLDGKDLRLSSLRGKAVLLNFWATYCGPCKVEIPWFIEFEKNYSGRGLAVLGVSMDEDGWKVVTPYVESKKMNYPVLLGNEQVAGLYGGLDALPTTLILDRTGKIASAHTGLVGKDTYEKEIQQLLAEK